MSSRLVLKALLLLVLFGTITFTKVYAQHRDASSIHREQSELVRSAGSGLQSSQSSGAAMVPDTLRNFVVSTELSAFTVDVNDPNSGWVHGTNNFEDIAKGTKLTLPGGAREASLTEVLVTFIYKSPTVTDETYQIQLYTVDPTTGAPGVIIASQTYNLADVNADNDFNTPAETQSHLFNTPVLVPTEFFVVVNFGSYGSEDYDNIAIASTDLLGRFVDEDWEQISDGTWINMSDSWFEQDNDGWYMWIEAVIERDVMVPPDPYENNNTADSATQIQDGFTTSGAAIDPVGDVDYYQFDADAGTTVEISTQNMTGSELNGMLSLYNNTGQLIASNDDFNSVTTQSRITTTLAATDTYFIRYAHNLNDSGSDFPNKNDRSNSGKEQTFLNRFREVLVNDRPGVSVASESSFPDDSGQYILSFTATPDNVDTAAPVIRHVVPSPIVPEGQEVTIRTDITDASGIAVALLAYLEGGRDVNSFTTIFLNPVGGDTFEGLIPASIINTRGVQYVFGATDGAGNASVAGPFDLQVSTAGLTADIPVAGTDESAYRLVSVPLDLTAKRANDVLEDDLGAYDPDIWRFFSLQANQAYSEFPNVAPMAPGAAFWLATSVPSQSFNTGPGISVSTAQAHSVSLNPGWTFVGTPFHFPVGLDQLSLNSDENAAIDIRTFQGSWRTATGPLQPFLGYAVFSAGNDALLIDPFPPDTDATSRPQADSQENLTAELNSNELDWSIHIEAKGKGALDSDNVIGVSSQARMGWDHLDRPEPPVIGDYVSLYFPHSDWDVPAGRFNVDIRPEFDSLQSWAFEVRSPIEEPLTMDFKKVESVPEEFDVVLIDNLLHIEQDLRTSSQYRFRTSVDPLKERFQMVIGKKDAIAGRIEEQRAVPSAITIQSYPNPFRGLTTLEYGIPETMPVSLHIYDLLGKKVVTLINDELKQMGIHAIQWDGTDQSGRPVASGVYLYALNTGTQRATRRVVVLR